MSESKKSTEKDNLMDVNAVNKGVGKGKSKSKGKGKPSNAENSNWQDGWKEKGDEHSDGWTWKGDEQADGWWNTTGWQTGIGSAWWTTGHGWTPWESEKPKSGIELNSMEGWSIEISSMERCSSKNHRRVGGEDHERKDSDQPHANRAKNLDTTRITALHDRRISIEDRVNSDRCRRRTPTPAATPRPISTRSPSQDSATSETSGKSETKASDTSETSSTSSVETLTLESLHTDLSSYNSDGRHVVHLVHCVP